MLGLRPEHAEAMAVRTGFKTSRVLVATWHDGVFSVLGETPHQELAGHSAMALPGASPRAADGVKTWEPPSAAYSVRTRLRSHRRREGGEMAADAVALCPSLGSGATWDVEQGGLHASYCSAVSFAGDDVLV